MRLPETTTRRIKRLFGFLVEDFDCRMVEAVRGTATHVTYANRATFVRPTVERGIEIYVQFGPLRDGTVPPYGPGWYDILDLAAARGEPVAATSVAVGRRELERCLGEHADVLRRSGRDVLRGDFSVLPRLDAVQRARLETQHGYPPPQ